MVAGTYMRWQSISMLQKNFLKDALDAYLLKYGKCTVVDNYMVFFEPLGVVDMNYGIE